MKKAFILTLGCPKNTVDSENMAYILESRGYEMVEDAADADYIIINTCSFIRDAMEESINSLLEATLIKKERSEVKLIATGCLAQRHAAELEKEMPEIDAFVGTGQFQNIADVLDSMSDETVIRTDDVNCPVFETGRVLSTAPYYAYLKVSEGCNKNCTYCIIPKLRGKQRSRRLEDIVREAETLAKEGVRELILISQDVGEYGSELYGKRMLPELLERLEKIEGIRWIRLLYIYPETISEELIDVMSASEKILHYIDMPLQHVNDRILRMMGRRTDRKEIEGIIRSLRDRMDDIIIRSTFITGFPTETDEEHEELLEFIRSARLDRVGFFTYSREEGTPAYSFEPQIEEDKKEERFDELMSAQEEVSIENLERFAGKTLEVIIEDRVEDGVYIGRSYMDTPDIDGEVYLESDDELEIGNIYKVLITDTLEYDLVGRKI